MKKMLLWGGFVALTLVGCATSRDRYARHEYYYPDQRETVVVEREAPRTYVREYEPGYDSRAWDRNMLQPRYRGKHPDSLGWNDPYWYGHDRNY